MRRPGLALAVVFALALACGGAADTPEAVAQRFVEAVQRGDVAKLLPMLEGAASRRLTAAAERATHHVGGRRTIAPDEMLQIVDVDPMLRVARVELLEGDESHARVRIHGSQQQTIDLSLVHEDGAWRVVIPTPDPPTP